jgi:hypothetical protein
MSCDLVSGHELLAQAIERQVQGADDRRVCDALNIPGDPAPASLAAGMAFLLVRLCL